MAEEQMITAIVGMFPEENVSQAETAVRRLKEEVGINESEMMVLAESDATDLGEKIEEGEEMAAKGATVGTALGSVAGMLGTMGIVTLAGFGTLVGAGVVGAFSGMSVGGYLGAIYSSRIGSKAAYDVKDTLANGGVLLLVELSNADEVREKQVRGILHGNGADIVDTFSFTPDELEDLEE